MLQRTKCERGDCTNARSPAPVQRRHAASIIRTRAARILFIEATRGPRPMSAAQLTQAKRGTAALPSGSATAHINVKLCVASCMDAISILEAVRVELQHVLGRNQVPSTLLRRVRVERLVPKPLRAQCRRGGPDTARSPASMVRQRAAAIVL